MIRGSIAQVRGCAHGESTTGVAGVRPGDGIDVCVFRLCAGRVLGMIMVMMVVVMVVMLLPCLRGIFRRIILIVPLIAVGERIALMLSDLVLGDRLHRLSYGRGPVMRIIQGWRRKHDRIRRRSATAVREA